MRVHESFMRAGARVSRGCGCRNLPRVWVQESPEGVGAGIFRECWRRSPRVWVQESPVGAGAWSLLLLLFACVDGYPLIHILSQELFSCRTIINQCCSVLSSDRVMFGGERKE